MKSSFSNKALLAGVLGTTLQWYDFAIFGYFAPIIAATYFPKENHFAALLSAFGIFAVGYLLAPLGSILFGYIGDRHGRKKALSLSILAIAIPTAMISIIPGYYILGITAPILITILRVAQGFVASSEFTGSAIFLVEHAKPGKEALFGCLTSSAYSFGAIVAGLMASLCTASFMPDWAWRLCFAVALIAGLLIFFLRTYVTETPEYQNLKAHEKHVFPFSAALKEAPFAVIGVIGIAWLTGIMTFGTYLFTATYLHTYLNMPLSLATLIITLSLGCDALLEPFIAVLADKVGLLRVTKFGMVTLCLLSIPIFYLISLGNVIFIMIGMIIMAILIAITYAPLNAYMVLLFPHQYRYSGFSVAFNMGISFFGGTTPLIMMWLIDKTGNFVSPSWYYVFGVIIGLISLSICEHSRSKTSVSQSLLKYSNI